MLGKRLPRADAEAKVRGLAVYGIDYEESRMLHAKILRSPVPAGRIVKLNVARALDLPGVHAAITADDTVDRVGAVVMDMPLMAEGEVLYSGEPIAAVAAETLEQAEAAVAMIEVQIEPHEAVTDLEQALAPDARLVHPNWQSYELDDAGVEGTRGGNIVWEARLDRGDVDAEFERADLIVEDEYRVPRNHQCYIEPRCGVAHYDNGRYVIHT